MNDPTDDEPEDSTDIPEETNEQPEQRRPRRLADSFKTSGAFTNLYSGPTFNFGRTISDEIVGKFNRQIAAALRPKLPPPSLYLMNFKYKSPLQDIAEEFNKTVRAQWAPVFESIQKLARRIFPENWGTFGRLQSMFLKTFSLTRASH